MWGPIRIDWDLYQHWLQSRETAKEDSALAERQKPIKKEGRQNKALAVSASRHL